MGQGPFAKRSAPAGPPAERRQSSRLDLVIPIVISGRDAAGQPFREATETLSVSFHGAAIKTRKQIPIGMQLTIENLATGTASKAICVRVGEAKPGQELHAIAAQLLMPANVWGVINPPADWQSAADAIQQAAPAARGLPPGATTAAAKTQPPGAPAARMASADLEQRSADLAESVLQLLRGQAAGILRESLKEFEERLKFLESGIEARVIQQAERAIADAGSRVANQAAKSVDDVEIALAGLRRELMEQLTARTERAILSAETAVRERIATLVEEHLKSGDALLEKKAEVETEK
ncbi:MAG: hypothetical protein ABSB82_22070 [Terriglobia bacterium]|jgi:hypothetical protein